MLAYNKTLPRPINSDMLTNLLAYFLFTIFSHWEALIFLATRFFFISMALPSTAEQQQQQWVQQVMIMWDIRFAFETTKIFSCASSWVDSLFQTLNMVCRESLFKFKERPTVTLCMDWNNVSADFFSRTFSTHFPHISIFCWMNLQLSWPSSTGECLRLSLNLRLCSIFLARTASHCLWHWMTSLSPELHDWVEVGKTGAKGLQ